MLDRHPYGTWSRYSRLEEKFYKPEDPMVAIKAKQQQLAAMKDKSICCVRCKTQNKIVNEEMGQSFDSRPATAAKDKYQSIFQNRKIEKTINKKPN